MAPHCNSPNRECFKEKLSIDKTNPLQQAALECDSKGLDRYDVTPTAEVQSHTTHWFFLHGSGDASRN